MFRLNEEKVFVDYIDDQMVALIIETGSYYTLEEIEKEFNNEGYFDLRGYRYSIIKYWE